MTAAADRLSTLPGRWIAGVGLFFIAAMAGLSAYDIVRSQREAVAEIGRDLQSQARVTAEQTARSLQAVDVVLRNVVAESRSTDLRSKPAAELHDYLKNQALGPGAGRGPGALRRQGRPLRELGGGPPAAAVGQFRRRSGLPAAARCTAKHTRARDRATWRAGDRELVHAGRAPPGDGRRPLRWRGGGERARCLLPGLLPGDRLRGRHRDHGAARRRPSRGATPGGGVEARSTLDRLCCAAGRLGGPHAAAGAGHRPIRRPRPVRRARGRARLPAVHRDHARR